MALGALRARWPGREKEIQQLYDAFSSDYAPGTCVFVFGGEATGKTGVCRGVLDALGKRYAYATCCSTIKPRQLMSTIADQLKGGKRKRADGYAWPQSCDNICDFDQMLSGVAPPGGRSALIVLDNAHELAKSPFLESLMQVVRKGTSSACVLLISRQPWEAGVFGGLPLHRPLLSLHFADYSNRQLLDVLGTDFGTARAQLPADAARRLPDDLLRTLHAAFLSSVILDSFGLLTRDVRELRPLAAALWLPYLEPLLAGRVPADAPIDTIVRRLFTHATDKHVPALLRSFRPGMLPALQLKPGGGGSAAGGSGSGGGWAAASPSTSSRPTAMAAVGGGGAAGVPSSAAAALQLTALNKLLVVAAFIASANRPTLDRVLFDASGSGGGGGRRRGGKRGGGGGQASDRQAEAAQEVKLKGPQAFPLQRLMMIVGRLCPGSLADLLEGRAASGVSSLLDASPSSRGGRGSADADGGGSMASTCPLDATAAMLGGISSLVSLRLLSAVGGDDGGGGGGGGGGDLLEGGRYVCNVPEALAAQLAADVNVQLSHYLRYA